MPATILVVEDEQKLRELLRLQLEREGYSVLTTGSGAEALEIVMHGAPELVILDLRLPDIPGEEVARRIREQADTAIVVLTASTSEQARIAGLEAGADDYVTKPFSPRELMLRVQAILRRSSALGRQESVASFGAGELVLDESRREAKVRGSVVDLTPTEWDLLASLANAPGRAYSRRELVNRVRGYEYEGYERSIDSHVKNLRHKVEAEPRHPRIVLTVLGYGYKLGIDRDGE